MRRISVAEGPGELFERFPLTDNDPDTATRVASAFGEHFGDRSTVMPLQTASADLSDIPTALGVPFTYWGFGGIYAETYREAGRVQEEIPVNHSASFAPAIQPPSTPAPRRWSSPHSRGCDPGGVSRCHNTGSRPTLQNFNRESRHRSHGR